MCLSRCSTVVAPVLALHKYMYQIPWVPLSHGRHESLLALWLKVCVLGQRLWVRTLPAPHNYYKSDSTHCGAPCAPSDHYMIWWFKSCNGACVGTIARRWGYVRKRLGSMTIWWSVRLTSQTVAFLALVTTVTTTVQMLYDTRIWLVKPLWGGGL